MHPRTLRLALFVSALALLLQLGPLGAAELVRVQRALDGDSLLLVDGRQVRLIGINAPELGKDGAPDEPLAAAARDRAAVLVRGQPVRLAYDAERFDRYGRTLAYVFLPDGGDLQEILVREGLAWFIAVPPNVARLAIYRAAEANARGVRRGIWAHAGHEPIPAERLSPGRTGFLRVLGTVQSVRYRRHTAELQLTAEVQLVVPRSQDFPWTPKTLAGKRVLVRGWLTEYKNGLRMRVAHPAMLEVVP